MTPEHISVFRYVNQVSTRETRSSVSGLLYVPKSRTEYYKRCFRLPTDILWNRLSEYVRTLNSMAYLKQSTQAVTVLFSRVNFIDYQVSVYILYIY